MNAKEEAAWFRVKRSVIVIQNGTRANMPAACIDSSGLFVAHKEAVGSPIIIAKMLSGRVVTLSLKSVDEITQLALLQISGPMDSTLRPVSPAREAPERKEKLLAVVGSKPIPAELANRNTTGIFTEKRRAVPLSEVRFEAMPQQVAGALVFNLNGELVGILNATLPMAQKELNESGAPPPAAADTSTSFRTERIRLPSGVGGILEQQFGPGEMTVAYSVAPSVLRRVISGFLSPSHKVLHPTIGIFCKDFVKGGAQVQSVTPGSPADLGGMRAGDVIISIEGQPVENQMDFARIMFGQQVGEDIEIVVRRDGEEVTLKVRVGELLAAH